MLNQTPPHFIFCILGQNGKKDSKQEIKLKKITATKIRYEQGTHIFQWILTMHKNERDGKWKNGLKVTSNPWTHYHKMQSGQVVKSKLRMYHGDRNLSKNNTHLTKCVWVCVSTQAPHVTSTPKFWQDSNPFNLKYTCIKRSKGLLLVYNVWLKLREKRGNGE